VTPILFQAPDVGLIAPDLVIYLDVQPEVFCLYSELVFHNEGARIFFPVLAHYLHTVVMIAIIRPYPNQNNLYI